MPAARPAPTLALALLLAGCGHSRADTSPPEAPGPDEAKPAPAFERIDAEVPDDPEPAAGDRTASRRITFDGDDVEPTPTIRSAPKRPPIPAFRLFGTRPTDGP